MNARAAEQVLIRRALGVPVTTGDVMDDLAGVDADRLGFAGWRALLLVADEVDPSSSWATRLQGLRRRSHYATVIGTRIAAALAAGLRGAGVTCSVTSDLALAIGYARRPGELPVSRVHIWVDPGVPVDRLVLLASTTVPGSRWTEGRDILHAVVDGMPVSLLRGWSAWASAARQAARPPATVGVDTHAGSVPIHDAPAEAHRVLATRGAPFTDGWLLDLAVVAGARPDIWPGVIDMAVAHLRATAVGRSWRLAHEAGVSPSPPGLPPDPVGERLRQWVQRHRPRPSDAETRLPA